MDRVAMVGGSAALEQVLRSVTGNGRSGCLVFGETGLGKTALARVVLDALRSSHPVFSSSGTATLAKLEFAAVAPFLAGMEGNEELTQQRVHAELSRFFRGCREESKQVPIVVVDDAHDMDPASRTILARLVTSDVVRIVALSPRSSMPVEFIELWTDGFLDTCNLEPLTASEIHEMCQALLRGPVLDSLSDIVADMSKGNPLCVEALLREGRANGSLLERDGVWMPAQIPRAGAALAARLRTSFSRLPSKVLELLEVIALAEPLSVGDLDNDEGASDLLDLLESQGLVNISGESPPSVRLVNPVFSEILRKTVSPVRSAALRAKYGKLMDTLPPNQLIRNVSWALDCGVKLPPEVLLRAVRAGNEEFDFHFTLRAAAAANGSEGADVDAVLLETAIAHSYLGHRFMAKNHLERVLRFSEDVPLLLNAVLWICQMRTSWCGYGQQHRISELLEELSNRINGPRPPAPGAAETIKKLLCILKFAADGKSADLEEALTGMAWNADAVDVRTRAICLTMLGDLLSSAGQYTKGHAATSTAVALLEENPRHLRMQSDYIQIHHIRGLLLGGEWNEAAVRMAGYSRASAGSTLYSGAALQLLQGALAVGQGRIKAGCRQLQPAVEGIRHGHYVELLPFGAGLVAYAAALCQEAEFVDECIESFPDQTTCSDPGLFLLGKAHVLAAMASIGRTDDAGRQLSELAEQAGRSGHAAAQETALALAVRVGHAESASCLASLTTTLDGPMPRALRLYSNAVLNADSGALLEAAAQARRDGFYLLAVDCAEQAVATLDTERGRAGRNSAQAWLRQYRTFLDGQYVLGTSEASRAARLTARECEIVALAQGGQSNRDIARVLSLSARTVEGHLYRIFAKVGVNSRAELLASSVHPELQKADQVQRPSQPAVQVVPYPK